MHAPKEELIVISTGCELLFVKTPFEAADFLLMSEQFRFEFIPTPEVPMQNALVPGTSAEEPAVPSYTADPLFMPCQCPDHLAPDRVPYL